MVTTIEGSNHQREQPFSPEYRQLRLHHSYGVAMFSAGPEFWNPSRSHPTGEELQRAIYTRPPVDIPPQWFIVDTISSIQRGTQKQKPTQQEIDAWIQGQVVPLFERLHNNTGEEAHALKHVFQWNFGINLDRKPTVIDRRKNTEYYIDAAREWWKKYFEGGSKAGLFIADLTKDLHGQDPTERLRMAEPFFYLFGGEETVALMRDATLAQHYMNYAKGLLITMAGFMGNYDFPNDTERRAYAMAWDLYRRGVMSADRETRVAAMRSLKDRTATPPPVEPHVAPQPVSPSQEPSHPPPEESPQPAGTPAPEPEPTTGPGAPSPEPQPVSTGSRTGAAAPSSPEETRETERQPRIVLAEKAVASPNHPEFCADTTVAEKVADGKSFLISAIDGIGSGREYSVQPAEFFRDALKLRARELKNMPTVPEGREVLFDGLVHGAAQVGLHRGYAKEKFNLSDDIVNQIGAVVSTGILCKKDETTHTFVTLNFGDARTLMYLPQEGRVVHLTTDHSVVQQQVREGRMSAEKAFRDEGRHMVYKTASLLNLGELQAKLETNKPTDELSETDLPIGQEFIAISQTDGIHDKIPPNDEAKVLAEAYRVAKQSGTFDPQAFTQFILQQVESVRDDDAGISIAYYSGE